MSNNIFAPRLKNHRNLFSLEAVQIKVRELGPGDFGGN
jgi:hypothetical protein